MFFLPELAWTAEVFPVLPSISEDSKSFRGLPFHCCLARLVDLSLFPAAVVRHQDLSTRPCIALFLLVLFLPFLSWVLFALLYCRATDSWPIRTQDTFERERISSSVPSSHLYANHWTVVSSVFHNTKEDGDGSFFSPFYSGYYPYLKSLSGSSLCIF